MNAETPTCCAPAAYRLLGRHVESIETTPSLIVAAVAVSGHRSNTVDVKSVDHELNKIAESILARVKGSQPQALLAHMHAALFDEAGFAGNRDQYDLDTNSYLPSVLQSKLGLPISLAIVYKAVAERLGFDCWGIGLPGHFLAGIEVDGSQMMIDCFDAGRILSADEARERLARQFDEEIEWSDDFLRPVTHRSWITRMLQNLLNLFGRTDRFTEVASMLELEMLLWPGEQRLQRDLGLVLARCGMNRPAGKWLDRYLDTHPDDPQYPELSQLRAVLK